MKYKKEINKIEKLINEDEFQESIHKMIELDSKIRERYGENDDAILEILDDSDNTIMNGKSIKETIHFFDDDDIIGFNKGDIHCLNAIEDDTYYKVVYFYTKHEIEIYNLTTEILKVVLDKIKKFIEKEFR